MLHAMRALLFTGQFASPEVQYACLESFAIHSRNLIDFLYPPERTKDDDVFAKHFFTDPQTWRGLSKSLPPSLKDARIQANKQISHLTYYRLSVKRKQKNWYFDAITAALDPLIATFAEHADLLDGETRTHLLAMCKHRVQSSADPPQAASSGK